MEFERVTVAGRFELLMTPERAAIPYWQWWERERLLAARAAIRPGDVVIDVGAERGELTALYGSWGADVAIVEPSPEAWPHLRTVWNANVARPPLACLPAFCDETSTHGWRDRLRHRDWPDETALPAGECRYRRLDQDNELPRATVDGLASALKVPVDVLMVDVEGSEWRVLRGAERTLARDKPTVLLSLHPEMLHDRWGEFSDDLLAWMVKVAGYEMHHLATDHEAHWLGCAAR